METRVKGTFILKQKGRFFKVITVTSAGDNWYTFECRDTESRQEQVFTYEILGLLEAMNSATVLMKEPKDILLVDLDNQGRWKILTKNEVDRISRDRSI